MKNNESKGAKRRNRKLENYREKDKRNTKEMNKIY